MPEDFRDLISRKMSAKQNQLGRIEDDIKKLVPNPVSDKLATGGTGNLSRFQNRLGPVKGRASGGEPLGSRLGPKVHDGDGDQVGSQRGIVRGGVVVGGGVVQSRVVMEVKSRDEVMAEKRATENKGDVQVIFNDLCYDGCLATV